MDIAATDLSISRRQRYGTGAVGRYLPDDLVRLVGDYDDVWIPPKLRVVERWFRRLDDQLSRGTTVGCELMIKYSKTGQRYRVAADIDGYCYDGNGGVRITVVDRSTGFRHELVDFRFDIECCPRTDAVIVLCFNQLDQRLISYPYAYTIVDGLTQTVAAPDTANPKVPVDIRDFYGDDDDSDDDDDVSVDGSVDSVDEDIDDDDMDENGGHAVPANTFVYAPVL